MSHPTKNDAVAQPQPTDRTTDSSFLLLSDVRMDYLAGEREWPWVSELLRLCLLQLQPDSSGEAGDRPLRHISHSVLTKPTNHLWDHALRAQCNTPCGGAQPEVKRQSHNYLRGLAVLEVARGNVPSDPLRAAGAPDWLRVLGHVLDWEVWQSDRWISVLQGYLRGEVGLWRPVCTRPEQRLGKCKSQTDVHNLPTHDHIHCAHPFYTAGRPSSPAARLFRLRGR